MAAETLRDSGVAEASPSEAGPAMAPAKSRDVTLDALRGMLIVLVVIGHFNLRRLPPGGVAEAMDLITSLIYLFHVPAFFVLSGILLRRPQSALGVLRAQLPLVTTFAFWALLSRWELLAAGDWKAAARVVVMGNWSAVQGVTWFLPALVSVRLLVAAWLRGGALVKGSLLAGSLVVVLGHEFFARHNAEIPWGLDSAFYVLPMIVVSRWAYGRLRGGVDRRWIALFGLGFVACAGLLFVLEPREAYNGFTNRIDMAQFNVAETPLNYLLLSGSVISLLCAFAAGIRGRLFQLLGVFSLTILVIHPKLISILTGVWPLKGGDALLGASVVAIVVICCALPMVIGVGATAAAPTIARYLGLTPQRDLPLVDALRGRVLKRLAPPRS